MSDDLAAEGEAVLAAATPAPWSHPRTGLLRLGAAEAASAPDFRVLGMKRGQPEGANAAAIVWLRNHAAELLAAYRDRERLAEERTRLRAVQADLTKRINHSADVCANEENRRRDAERALLEIRRCANAALDMEGSARLAAVYALAEQIDALAASRESQP